MEYCVHIYEGNGKGKTTAAIGLAVRAHGVGNRVVITQFLKGLPTGEIPTLERIGIPIHRTEQVDKFVFQMSDEEKAQTALDCKRLIDTGISEIEGGAVLLIMDEVLDAIGCGLITNEELIGLLDVAKGRCEVVLTGRNPDPLIVDRADYYTKMTAVKHPYERGLQSRKGIEF